jgi:hypothetical protein
MTRVERTRSMRSRAYWRDGERRGFVQQSRGEPQCLSTEHVPGQPASAHIVLEQRSRADDIAPSTRIVVIEGRS